MNKMTSFGAVLKQMLKTKSRGVYIAIGLQLIGAIISSILFIIKEHSVPAVIVPLIHFVTWGIAAGLCYFIYTIIQNEKINTSQTWRLIPISDTKFYLSNILSAMIAYIYFLTIEFIAILILLATTFFSNSVVHDKIFAVNAPKDFWANFDWIIVINGVLMIFLTGVLIYLTFSLINLSSRTIIDFVPIAKSKLILIITRLIIITIVFILVSRIGSSLISLIQWLLKHNSAISSQYTSLYYVNISLLIIVLIFGAINIWLINKFVEAKIE